MFDAFWLPDGCGVQPPTRVEKINREGRTIEVRWPAMTPQDVRQLALFVRRRRQEVLERRTVGEIVATLDAVAERWLDRERPEHRRAVEAIGVVTGFSAEMVAHSIELEQVSSRSTDLLAALDNELGNHRALDDFVASPKGLSYAVGPGLIGGSFSANIPALPHLTVMRALLVKSACIGRVSRGEPLYLPLYVASLAEFDPELASCLGVVYWPRENTACTDAFLQSVDHLIAYGGEGAIGDLNAALPDGTSASWHGHKMGFCYVTRRALGSERAARALAESIAYDFSVFDQHACLSPQACFVEEGGVVSPEAFAELLAAGMKLWLERLPPRALSVGEAAGLRAARDEAEMNAVMGDGSRLFTPSGQLQGTVVFSPMNALAPSPLERWARVVPVADGDALCAKLAPVSRFLQCAVIAEGAPGECAELKRRLAVMGVSRICSPGAAGTPSMVWHHDGRACLSELVRWCDEEQLPPGDSES